METKQAKRAAQYYDEYPNCRIRDLMNSQAITSVDLAEAINRELSNVDKSVTPEAVRQWAGGYARPDISKLPALSKALDCSIDYLMGLAKCPSFESSFISYYTGLSNTAIKKLKEFRFGKRDQGVIVKDAATKELQALNALIESEQAGSFLTALRGYLYGRYKWATIRGINGVTNAHEEASAELDNKDFCFEAFEMDSICTEIYDGSYLAKMLSDSKMAQMQEQITRMRMDLQSKETANGKHRKD